MLYSYQINEEDSDMMMSLYRMIIWAEHYGLSKEEICDMLDYLVDHSSSVETEESRRLETVMREISDDPLFRAKLFNDLMLLAPDEELESEETSEHMQLLPLFLRSLREIVETVASQEEVINAIDAILI